MRASVDYLECGKCKESKHKDEYCLWSLIQFIKVNPYCNACCNSVVEKNRQIGERSSNSFRKGARCLLDDCVNCRTWRAYEVEGGRRTALATTTSS